MAAAVALAVLNAGCDDDDGDGLSAAAAAQGQSLDLNGDWSGSYYILDSEDDVHTKRSISAKVVQSGQNVAISTTKTGPGRDLAGTVTADGSMNLIDAYDGETWTTFLRRATADHILINDILWPEELKHPEWGKSLATIDLRR